VIGWEDHLFTYNVLSGMLNPTVSICDNMQSHFVWLYGYQMSSACVTEQ